MTLADALKKKNLFWERETFFVWLLSLWEIILSWFSQTTERPRKIKKPKQYYLKFLKFLELLLFIYEHIHVHMHTSTHMLSLTYRWVLRPKWSAFIGKDLFKWHHFFFCRVMKYTFFSYWASERLLGHTDH